jgi:hypothetical protein
MPSNIEYGTPSSDQNMLTPPNLGSPSPIPRDSEADRQQALLDHNAEAVNKILIQILNGDTPSFLASADGVERYGRDGARCVFEERYEDARNCYKADSAKAANWRGKRYQVAIGLDHIADLMDAARHLGGPQTISLRFTQILSRRLMIERLDFLSLPPDEQSVDEFRQTMTGLVSDTATWTEIITLQRAFQTWKYALGIGHPSLAVVRRRIDEYEKIPGIPIEKVRSQAPFIPAAPVKPLYQTLTQFEIPFDKILELAPLPEVFKDMVDLGPTEQQLRTRRGRSQAYLGGYFSFLGEFSKAEEAFQESNSSLQIEDCVEIKLHRMLWHCEHYTRAKNWNEIGPLLVEAHRVFMEPETNSSFVISHFPGRFRLLCKAVVTRLSIDVVIHDFSLHGDTEPKDFQTEIGAPQAPSPVLEVERLFPLQPNDHSAIDVDAWRQFVTFQSPPALSPPTCSPQLRINQQLLVST